MAAQRDGDGEGNLFYISSSSLIEGRERFVSFDTRGLERPLWKISSNVRGSVINRGLLIAALLTVLDVLLISHYQPASALAVLQYTPPLALLLGVLVNLLPILLPLFALLSSAIAVARLFDGNYSGGANLLVGAIMMWLVSLCFVDATLYPWGWYGIALVIFVVTVPLAIISHATSNSSLTILVGVVIAALVLGYAVLSGPRLHDAIARPFLAPEMITVANPQSRANVTVTGYVLNVDLEWTTVLRDQDRTILVFPNSYISARQPCELAGEAKYQPLITIGGFLPARSRVPACDTS